MKKLPKQKYQSGLTILEILVTLTIGFILMSVAIPSMTGLSQRNSVRSNAEMIANSLKYARSEAIRRGANVTVCPSSDMANCVGTWSDGWITFVDDDQDGVVDTGEQLVRVVQEINGDGSISVTATLNTAFYSFDTRGTAQQTATFIACSSSKNIEWARGVIMLVSGAVRFGIDSNADGVREDHNGGNFTCP